MKTLEESLNLLSPEQAVKWLRNAGSSTGWPWGNLYRNESLRHPDAYLRHGFSFILSPEGGEYWNDICNSIRES